MSTEISITKPKVTALTLFICLLVAVFYSYDLFIRVAPSVMIPGLKSSLHIDETMVGWLSAAYFYAYVVFQIPAGIVLDKYNSRWVISGAMFICMLGNWLFSVAPDVEVAMVGRVLMGIGSAFGFIGVAKVAAMWLPPRFFSWFMGVASFIGIMGGLVADTVLDAFVHQMGWRVGNNVFTWIGIVILILMLFFIRDNKSAHLDSRHMKLPSLMEQMGYLAQILKSYRFWIAGLIGAVLFIPINVLASLWGVGFIEVKLGVSQSEAAGFNSLLFLGSAVGFILVSVISIYVDSYRKMLAVGSLAMMIIVLALIYIPMPTWMFASLIFLLGVAVGPEILVFEIGKFLSPKRATATAVSGINMINNLVGALLLPAFGWLLLNFASNPEKLSIADYDRVMLTLPICCVISFIMCMAIPRAILRK